MLLDGINHVAVLTNDSERFHKFYREVFDAEVSLDREEFPGGPAVGGQHRAAGRAQRVPDRR